MPASRAIEPIAAILALGIGEPLLLFALGTHSIHLAGADVIFKNQSTFCTNFGVATMICGLTARRRTDKNRMAGVTPVLVLCHFFTNRALFHQNSSTPSMSDLYKESTSPTGMTLLVIKIIISPSNFQRLVQNKHLWAETKEPDLQGPALYDRSGKKISRP